MLQALLTIAMILLALLFQESLQGDSERHLYKTLLDSYESLARPTDNESEPVVVSLGISLQQIVDIDEKNQIIQLNVWLTYHWHDYRFQWIPEEHGGVKELRMPPGKIWKPDVLLYNSAGENFDSTYPSNVVVKYDGKMEWIPPGIIKGTCKIDITWFPFDDQRCALKFGSWTFSGSMLDLRVGEVNNSTYTENGEWSLIAVIPVRNEFKYDCCPEPYYDVTFTIWVSRRTLYYGFNLIIPCLLISFMTLLDFTLPPEAGEKLSLGVTIFMSLCVFLLMVAEAMPPTSDAVPLIGVYFSSIMIVVSASLVFTVLVLNIHHRKPETHEMGDLVRKIFLSWLPWVLMMKRPGYICTRGQLIPKQQIAKEMANMTASYASASKSLLANILDIDDNAIPRNLSLGRQGERRNSGVQCAPARPPLSRSTTEGYLLEPIRPLAPAAQLARMKDMPATISLADYPPHSVQYVLIAHLEPVLQAIYKELKIITAKMKKDEEVNDVINDWKFAAMVVDRLSLIIFTSILVISTCAILFSAPHIG